MAASGLFARIAIFGALLNVASSLPRLPRGLPEVPEAVTVPRASEATLYVGISSLARVLAGQIEERRIEVSWWSVDYFAGDRVILYQHVDEPSFCNANVSAIVEQVAVDADASWTRLDTSMPPLEPGDLIDERCQYFWAGYVRADGSVAACNCLRARPTWMADLGARIRDVKLRELAMAGTHDAAAYAQYLGVVSNNIATKYAITQNENLLAQLSMGVRYLDMRVVFMPGNEHRFWTHHGTYLLRPLVNETALVAEFLSRNTAEVVIFDMHGVDSMDQEAGSHQELQDLLYEELGEWMAPASFTWEATLGDFWTSGKRLIVTYNHAEQATASPFMWPAVQHQWGNVNELVNLETYLQSVMERASEGQLPFAWSAMAELTPNTQDVVTDRLDGLRNAADIVNRNATIWFRDRWSANATIVANDFFLGTDIVNVAIQENQRRFP